MEYLKKLKVTRVDVNSLVMNFLLAKGYAEAAEKFHLESDTECILFEYFISLIAC